MIAIEDAFAPTTESSRAKFLEAAAIAHAQIVTRHHEGERLDIALLRLPLLQTLGATSAMGNSAAKARGIMVMARTVEEAGALTFSLYDEGWLEKLATGQVACVAYVLALGTEGVHLPQGLAKSLVEGVEFDTLLLRDAIKHYASHGDLISLARRTLFAAADAISTDPASSLA